MKKLSLLLLTLANVAMGEERAIPAPFVPSNRGEQLTKMRRSQWSKLPYREQKEFLEKNNLSSMKPIDINISFMQPIIYEEGVNSSDLPTPAQLYDMGWQEEEKKAKEMAEIEKKAKIEKERNFIRLFRAIIGSTDQGPLQGRDQIFRELTEANVFDKYCLKIMLNPPVGEDEEITLITKIIAECKKEDDDFCEKIRIMKEKAANDPEFQEAYRKHTENFR
jgi:hypothetical protein